jgi:hypothetical protein
MLLIVEVVLPQSGAWTQYYHNQEHGHSTATIRSIDTVLPQSGAWTQYYHNQEHGHITSTIRSMDTALPQSGAYCGSDVSMLLIVEVMCPCS